MKLNVKNFGAISSANIDLSKDLIIFTGQNNTGKTYLAYLVYLVNDWGLNFPNPAFISNSLYLFKEVDKNAYTINIKKYFNKYIGDYLDFYNKKIDESLTNFFVVNKTYFKNTQVHFIFNKTHQPPLDPTYPEYSITLTKSKAKVNVNLLIDNDILTVKLNYIKEQLNKQDIDGILSEILKSYIGSAFQRNAHLIPAERQGINLFNKELSLIKNKTFDKLLTNGSKDELLKFLQTRFNKYPRPIQDSLEDAQNLDTLKNTTSEFAYLADELDNLFLDGKIIINKEGDIQFRPEGSKQVLEIHMASSTVKSLSSLSIYLRHIAKKGDLIIIDEPELNLHPDNQRKIARFFARLIHEGFKILISTHSEYIIRELNNLIMLKEGMQQDSVASKKLLRKYKYSENELLEKKQVGVHLFKKGKPVKNVKVTNTGFDISTIDRESQQLNQSSQDIFFTLFDS